VKGPIQPNYDRSKLNTYLFQAVFLEGSGAYKEAARIYERLYRLTGEELLLRKQILNTIRAREYEKAKALLEEALQKEPNNPQYLSLLAQLLYKMKRYEEAKRILHRLIALRPEAKSYQLLASIYLLQKRYDLALKYYKSAYAISPNEHTINSIAYIIYFYLDRPKEAIAHLESHIRIYGCQRSVCKTLASLYGLTNDIEGLISVYRQLYQRYKDPHDAKKLVELYVYQKEYDQAIHYAKELGDGELLLELYKAKRAYNQARALALKLYRKEGDPKYLALAAIFKYEGAKVKDSSLVEQVARELEEAIAKGARDPIYLNYLGYLYIDHGVNIPRGIELVQKALEKEPNSPYYLDSLAWGYYKLGRCPEALRLIKRVYYQLGLKDPEVEEHLRAIQDCIQRSKRDTR